MSDARLWKNLVGAISTLIDEGTFDIDKNGIKLRAMDPSHVAMVDFEWPKTVFDDYTCDTPTKLCINISEMLKFLKRIGSNESLELSVDPQARLNMILKGKYTRTFNMATLEPITEEIPAPKISFNAIAKISTSCLRNAMDDISTVSDYIQFEMTPKKLIMHASGYLGSVSVEVGTDSEDLLSLSIKEKSKATFSLNYLSETVKAASTISDVVTIEFSKDMPIRLNFEMQKGKLQYYLAPRIENT
jgi:proliferating cell nuclear antigen